MKTLIVYDGFYGSTEQYARWIAERLEDAHVRRAAEVESLDEFDAIIVGEPIYMEKVFPTVREFLEKNAEELKSKITAAFVVCLDPDFKYARGKIMGGVNYLSDLLACFKSPPLHAAVFGGEMNPRKMSEEHTRAILRFYKVAMGETRTEVPYVCLMSKAVAWKFAEEMLSNIEKANRHKTLTGLKAAVGDCLAKKKDIMTMRIAGMLKVSEDEVIRALPDGMASELSSEAFDEILTDITGWGRVMVIAWNDDAVMEVQAELPAGKFAMGMLNLHGSPLGMHIFPQNVGSIWCVDKPAHGRDSSSVRFFNKNGNCMFAVYLGRDPQTRAYSAGQTEKYKRLKKRFAAQNLLESVRK